MDPLIVSFKTETCSVFNHCDLLVFKPVFLHPHICFNKNVNEAKLVIQQLCTASDIWMNHCAAVTRTCGTYFVTTNGRNAPRCFGPVMPQHHQGTAVSDATVLYFPVLCLLQNYLVGQFHIIVAMSASMICYTCPVLNLSCMFPPSNICCLTLFLITVNFWGVNNKNITLLVLHLTHPHLGGGGSG